MKGKKTQQKQAEKSPEKEKTPQNKKEDQKKSSSNSKPKDNKTTTNEKSNPKDSKEAKESNQKTENKEKPKLIKYKLDFIFRREKYTLKNLQENYLVSKMKKLIAKEINVDIKTLKFFYKEEEIRKKVTKIIYTK